MSQYHGPREYLDAAMSTDTPAEELARLALSEYSFVRLAVARNARTPSSALSRLVSASLESYAEQEVAEAVAARMDAPSVVLERLAAGLAPHLHGGRKSHVAFGSAVALCSNPATPFEALRVLLSPSASKPQFRKVVARQTCRPDVLELLKSDVSSKVAARASATLSPLVS